MIYVAHKHPKNTLVHSVPFCIYIYCYILYVFLFVFIEGSLEVKLPTIWTDEKQSWADAERRGEQKREDQRRERVRRKKMQMREKVGKS